MLRYLIIVLGATLSTLSADGVEAQEQSAYSLLPDSVQAIVWIPSGQALVDGWNKTELAELAQDAAVRPFFEEQRVAIERRLMDAGWRLTIKPQDLSEHLEGQIAVAWLEKPNNVRKPFALALIAEVSEDKKKNTDLLNHLDTELRQQNAAKSISQYSGVELLRYTLPKRPDQLLAEDSYYAIAGNHLFSTDDEELMKQLVDRVQGKAVSGKTLAEDPLFIKAREKLGVNGGGQLEYYVRPLGIARVIRGIAGKRSKSSTDLLAVMENQGFTAIKCICGEVSIGRQHFDMQHRGYVVADFPLPKAAAVLAFPNKASRDVPSFIGPNIASLLVLNWNAADAFWKVRGLVDEIAGTEGVFDEVIEGIKKDPNGPRIDIANEVLPQFTNDIYSITDNREGEATVDSRRNLIALRVKDPVAMGKVLERAMLNEPDAEQLEIDGVPVWKVVHREDEEVTGLDGFEDFGAAPAAKDNAPEPWLSNWAITVYDGYLMFASHAEMIEQAIAQSKNNALGLASETDYKRIDQAIDTYFGDSAASAWQVVRNSKAYEVQYELFRQGKLRESQSMLASILDRLVDNASEIEVKEQKVKGEQLPPFDQIEKFLNPSGLMVRTTENGWEFGGILLGRSDKDVSPTVGAVSGTAARVSNSEGESKR